MFLNALGMPTLVECKLWCNPEARREVVGQIPGYARALRRWTYADLQREAARSRRQKGFDLHAHISEKDTITHKIGLPVAWARGDGPWKAAPTL